MLLQANILVENFIVCFVLPLLVRRSVQFSIKQVDDRKMYSITICAILAYTAGASLAGALLFAFDFWRLASIEAIWSLQGPWHDPRVIASFERNLSGLSFRYLERLPPYVVATINVLLWGGLLVNTLIAVTGWRSVQAVRGILGHLIIATYAFYASIFVITVGLWLLHWLNFWIFLVILIFVEFRRREERGARLSF